MTDLSQLVRAHLAPLYQTENAIDPAVFESVVRALRHAPNARPALVVEAQLIMDALDAGDDRRIGHLRALRAISSALMAHPEEAAFALAAVRCRTLSPKGEYIDWLVDHQPPGTIGALVALIGLHPEHTERDIDLRRQAFDALSVLGTPIAADLALAALDDADARVRLAAVDYLVEADVWRAGDRFIVRVSSESDPESFAAMVAALADWQRVDALPTLGALRAELAGAPSDFTEAIDEAIASLTG